jgi:predicted DNA-binding transcriptional regulator AlpA
MRRKTDTTPQIKRQFLSETELEQLTGVARRTWQKHRLFNVGPRWYKLQGAVRYDLAEVLDWIKRNAGGGGEAAR